ncbi:MAG: methionine adenosyltransferase [Lentisphaerae bacterium]|nr:MAG: methionine adenosyltransferase [Lentisphaerota bacterium]
MSKIRTSHIYTSESVSEGHPDKLCDQISDAVLDACLKQDPASRVACECLTTTDLCVIAGEITTQADVDYEAVARDVIRKVGYNDPELKFSADTCEVMVRVHTQSPDISQGVTEGEGLFKEQGAGDQGMMFGYASNETPAFMPAPIYYAHRMLEVFADLRKGPQADKYRFLRPDSKSQISIAYENGQPKAVTAVVISHQHAPDMERETLEELVRQVTHQVIPAELLTKEPKYFVNPTGRFVIGGPHGDCGLTGRKIIVDTYGGVGSHGGGAFSGKDPSKVDRSAAYYCRYIAKNIVAAGAADKCEIQVAYAIGVPEPISINIDTYQTAKVDESKIQALVEKSGIFDLRPARLIAELGLRTPSESWCYRQTAAYGHFGRDIFPWERLDKVEAIRNELGLN